jgi:hypothetical protein
LVSPVLISILTVGRKGSSNIPINIPSERLYEATKTQMMQRHGIEVRAYAGLAASTRLRKSGSFNSLSELV